MLGLRKSVEILSRNHGVNLYRFVGRRLSVVLCALLGLQMATLAQTPVNVTTWHNDIGRTGQNLNETTLNLTNVNSTAFGKLFSQSVDGQIYAQPLYMSGVTINGVKHNVVYVATEHDSVYAFDADSNGGTNSAPLWKASFLTAAYGAAAGATTVSSTIVGYDITPEIGITGTPVIDPATGTLYVVGKTYESKLAVQRLHALDIATGAEKFGGPVKLSGSVAGTGNGSVNGTLTFDQMWESNRPGLLLLNGIVYIGFAAHGDNGPWHGWILGYNAATLQQTGAYCASPNGTGSGFWMSGEGLAADQVDPVNKPFGRIYAPTGNGDYNATTPYTNSMDYGDSHLALDLTNGIPTIVDEFTTNQQAALNSQDGDVGSGGLMVLPDQAGPTTHMAVHVGKGGTFYVLNRENMGGYNLNADQTLQSMTYSVGNVGAWSTPAYWNGNIYWWGRFDKLKSFPVVNGVVKGWTITSTEQYGYPGSTPSISANGTSQAIVWSIDSSAYTNNGPAVLQAHDASKVSTTLYSSATNAARDAAGAAVKFVVPTVANGKVYVGTANQINIYGLLNGITQTASPVISPGSQSYAGSVTVTITDATPNASIYYTTDGSAASPTSKLYTGPFSVTSTQTINAIGSANGLLLSAQSSATYTNISQANAVVFSLPTGTYTSVQSLTLSDVTANSTIYYTTDGSTPTTSSTVYTGPITINSTEVVSAIAAAPGVSASPVISNTYTIQLGATGISFSQGFAAAAGIILTNGSAQFNDSRLQLTSGLAGQNGSAWYKTPVNVQAFTSDFTFQLSNPNADGMTFAIQNAPAGISALGGNGYALGYAGITKSIAIKFDLYNSAGEGANSTGLYINGANPTVPAINLTGTGINLHSDDQMAVHLVYDGTTLTMTITDMVTSAVWSTNWTINIPSTVGASTAYVGFTGGTGGQTASQKILTWSYFATLPTTSAATPTFSPAGGTYATAQNVTISDATSGATIYYTTDGSAPTTASAVYSAPIAVAATKTIKALAAVSGSSSVAPSAVATATYTISSVTATPTFSPAGGTFSTSQTVTISDGTAGATIYYTLDGSTPTTTSAVYTAPLTVGTTKTVKAIADVANSSAVTPSAVASATYTITSVAATPTFSPTGGTYSTAQTVTISDTTAGATIYYTLDGSTPTTASAVYSAALTVGTTKTLKAIAAGTGSSSITPSAVATATYTISSVAATPTFSPAGGTYAAPQTVTISDGTAGATIYYTLDGSTPTVTSAVYTAPLTVSATQTVKAIADVANSSAITPSAVATATYTITPPAATPTFSVAGGTYAAAQTVAISDTTAGATVYYTTNGATPTTTSTVYSAPLTVSATQTVKAIAVASGYSASAVASATYTIGARTANVVLSPGSGTYAGPQTVTLTDTTPGAKIYYTTDGSLPNAAKTLYTGPVAVNQSLKLQAIAFAPGFTGSGYTTGVYTINAPIYPTATPTFSIVSGTYTGAQTVTLSDATAGATIYYTTDGSTPTTASTVYTTAIAVNTTQTINALATAPGFLTSSVGTASYTISSATPVINFPSGFTATGLSLVNGSSIAGTAIKVTDGGAGEARAAWYTTPVNIQQFTTDFNFQLPTSTADGFTFAIQNAPKGQFAIGGNGSYLGYGSIVNSVAVKFDLYDNAGEGGDSTGIYTGGAVPTLPSVDMSASGLTLHNGNVMEAHITYDGTTLTVTITDTVTGATFTTSSAVNIPALVGKNTAYVGFTGGTGGATATQNILNWTYSVD